MKKFDQIKINEENIKWLDERQNISFSSSSRTRLAGGLFDQAREHHKSIVVLFYRSFNGSALALVRPLIESYLRGLWLQRCATDDEIDKYLKPKDIGSIQNLINRVEKTEGFESGVLSTSKKSLWKAACGFTHSGIEQISRRQTETDVGPNYDDQEIVAAMNASLTYDFMTFLAMCELGSATELAEEALERFKSLNLH